MVFLFSVIALCTILAVIKPGILVPTLRQFISILLKIVPVLIAVFVIMVLINSLFEPKQIVKYLGREAGLKGWLIAIFGGILSHGAIYMWYPLLNEMQKKGVQNRFIAAFLYNRAIKIPVLPLLVLYFGLAYAIVLAVVMILASIAQGIIVEKLVGDAG